MKITVKASHSDYDIIVSNGSFSELCRHIEPFAHGTKVFVVTDDNVNAVYGKSLYKILSGYDFRLCVLPHGERSKSLDNLRILYSQMASFGMSRADCLLSFGGGVIGDLAGFAAATFLRGIKYIQVPTTLLAQVDSSVGGKVAIDLSEGKNLVGSFYPPCLVVADPELLRTLPGRVFNDGMAEVIKYAAICDAELFETLMEDISPDIDTVIARCIDIKRRLAERDEFDTGERMILNFGHTFGHVAEKLTGYEKYTHGECVAMGMLRITQKSEKMGITQPGTAHRLQMLLDKYGLVFDRFEFDRDLAKQALMLDKKSTNDQIRYIMLERIGKAVIREFAKDDMFLLEE